MATIIIAFMFIIFFLLILPHILYGFSGFATSLVCFTLSAAFGMIKLMVLFVSMIVLFTVFKFMVKRMKTGN